MGNQMDPNPPVTTPPTLPDYNISALVLMNGQGPAVDLSGQPDPEFTYSPSLTAASHAAAIPLGGYYTGLDAVRAACGDGLGANWVFNGMPAGPSGFYAAAGNTNSSSGPLVSVGYMTASEYAGTGNTTFGKVTMSGLTNSVVMRETYAGDTTLKGYVDTSDYGNWRTGYIAFLANSNSTQDWSVGDFGYTGHTDSSDYLVWRSGYVAYLASLVPPGTGNQLPGPQSVSVGGGGPMPAGSSVTATPEPASLALLVAGVLGIGALGFLAKRRETRARG
jgi:hypothetical protein